MIEEKHTRDKIQLLVNNLDQLSEDLEKSPIPENRNRENSHHTSQLKINQSEEIAKGD